MEVFPVAPECLRKSQYLEFGSLYYQTPFVHAQMTHLEIHAEFTDQTLCVKSTASAQRWRYD